MHAAEVEVAFGGHVGDVSRDAVLFAQLPDLRRRGRVVYGNQDHVGGRVVRGKRLEVGRLKNAVDVCYLVAGDAVADLGVETAGWADDGDLSIGIQDVNYAPGCHLRSKSVVNISGTLYKPKQATHFASTNDQDMSVLDPPCKNKTAAALNFRELGFAVGHGLALRRSSEEGDQDSWIVNRNTRPNAKACCGASGSGWVFQVTCIIRLT
jgi:hypothetical protein